MSQPATTVVTATGSYRVVPDTVLRAQALAVVELSNAAGSPPAQVRAISLDPLTRAHVTDGHLVVTGRTDRALPHLATSPGTLRVRLERPGRLPQRVELTIPTASPLPWRTTVELDAVPVTVTGRVREADFPHSPVPGAEIAITGTAGALVALRTPLGRPHAAGTTVQIRALTGNATTSLADAVSSGADRVRVASAAGIGPTSVLELGGTERIEHARVLETLPGDVVVLRSPLVRSHPANQQVRRRGLGAVGSATTLARASVPGDSVLGTAAALSGAVLEVVDGAASEIRAVGLISDADGGWRLDGVRGMPSLTLTVSAPGFQTSGPVSHPLDGDALQPQVLDVELTT